MTDLYIVLISLAALIIFVVLVINWWQERKYRQEVERGFTNKQQDALLQEHQSMFDDVSVSNEAVDAEKLNAFLQTHDQELNADDDIATELEAMSQLADQKTRTNEANIHKTSIPKTRIEPQFGRHTSDTITKAIDELEAANPFGATLAKSEPSVIEMPEQDAIYQPQLITEVSPETEIKGIFEEAFNTDNPYDQEDEVTKDSQVTAGERPVELDLKVSLPTDLHGQIDLIGLLYLAAETPIGEIKAPLAPLLGAYDKRTFIHVLTPNNIWLSWSHAEALDAGLDTLVSRVTCSMQLADRAGPVSRTTLNRFQLDVESAGLAINAHVAWQSAGDALNTANELDAFCVEVDQTVRFHLKHGENGAFTGTKLRGLAESQGFRIADNGTFKFIDAATNRLLFVMYNQDNHPFSPEMLRTSVVKGVTFELDIPNVKNCAEVFSQMVQVARQMEISLNAVLVDDNQKILGDIQIEKIRQYLKVIQAKMLVKGVAPGSDEASRLFV
jgi:FtsZ-interacting cell division protein ZipA